VCRFLYGAKMRNAIDGFMDRFDNISPALLKEQLGKYGRSQAGLARHLGIDTSAVNRIVNGKRQIKAAELKPIHDYLELTDTSGVSEDEYISSAQMKNEGAQRIMHIARHAIDRPLREFILESWANVFSILRGYLNSEVNISPPDATEDFWRLAEANPEVLVLMGLGKGIVDGRTAAQLRSLDRAAERAIALDHVTFESDPEARAALKEYLAMDEEVAEVSARTLRSRLAVQGAMLSFVLSGDKDGLKSALSEMIDVLKPIVDRMDGNPPHS
jgi:transcriptional regulator with XRE-family HTH domain